MSKGFDRAMDQELQEAYDAFLFKYGGTYFQTGYTTAQVIDSLKDMTVRDNDVFLVTFPKSGTVWLQQILCLIFSEAHINMAEDINSRRSPWIEYNLENLDFNNRPSPRLFSTHLPYYLIPEELRTPKGKIIYVYRNPKDNMVSFYHFCKLFPSLKKANITWDAFFDWYMAGKVYGGLYFDHLRGWYTHKEDFNCIFLTYEDMIKDLKSAVLKICEFLEIKLDDDGVDRVVEKSTFQNMKKDPLANYESVKKQFLDQQEGSLLRKGTIGDWKNLLTVAQSEKVDKVLQEKLGDLSLKFIWDINEE
ncbi:amine sulfotransferase-like isoform X1 [Bufo gargarizans]|uniref:amine sulfotransferase-like isoform X1 n=1 Tax=Bufo gargarizans TaxID=30331 RepID=UPI001CF45D05|nr:amine sulfotransferase-like isoform X1 [Bufo gargarizans]